MSFLSHKVLLDRLYGTIYGNCIGDAIGLLTEFMNKTKAISVSFFSFLLFLSGYQNLCVHMANRSGYQRAVSLGGVCALAQAIKGLSLQFEG